MAPRRGDDADRDNAERVIHRQGGDGAGRTAAGGASTFRNGREGGLARAAIVRPRERVGNVSGACVSGLLLSRGRGSAHLLRPFGEIRGRD